MKGGKPSGTTGSEEEYSQDLGCLIPNHSSCHEGLLAKMQGEREQQDPLPALATQHSAWPPSNAGAKGWDDPWKSALCPSCERFGASREERAGIGGKPTVTLPPMESTELVARQMS